MICRYCCHAYIADGFDVRPCPECGGCGFIHCCEGERPDQCPEHSRGATPQPVAAILCAFTGLRFGERRGCS
jgi:hypothetical protein